MRSLSKHIVCLRIKVDRVCNINTYRYIRVSYIFVFFIYLPLDIVCVYTVTL